MHEECDFAVGTIQLYQNLIFPAFQMAVDDDLIRKNPCVGCMKDYPRGSLGSNKEPLTVEEQNELLRFAQNSVIYEKYYVLLAFLLSTGLRISEAIGITWDDIHLDEGYVEVNHQIIYRKIDGESKLRVHLPKNGCSRVVPMKPEIVRLLKKYKKATYWTSRLCEFEVGGLHNFVFLNKELRLYTPNTLTRVFHELTEAQNREMGGEEKLYYFHNLQLMFYVIPIVRGWQKTDVISKFYRKLWDTRISKLQCRCIIIHQRQGCQLDHHL